MSFWGSAERHEAQLDLDSDDSEYIANPWMHYFLNTPVQEIIVISQNSKIYNMWCVFDILMCLISSYYYAMISTLDHPKTKQSLGVGVIFFETVFAISFFLNFFVEFYSDGNRIPTKNIKLIAKRYLKNDFLLDLIPLIPFAEFITLKAYRE